MPEFLSAEWFDAVREAAAGIEVDRSLDLVVEQVVCTEHDEFRYQLCFGEGRLAVVADPQEPADVVLTADRPVAAAIAAGRRSAQDAFMTGELRIGGDIATLIAAREAIAQLGDVFASAREEGQPQAPTDDR